MKPNDSAEEIPDDLYEQKPKRPRPKPWSVKAEPSRRRILVDWYYRIQKARIAMGNAIAGLRRDYPSDYTQVQAAEDERVYLTPLEQHEALIARNCAADIKNMAVAQWMEKCVRGISWNFASQLVGLIGDIARFDTISKLWKYAGTAPGQRRVIGGRCDHSPALKRLMFNVGCSFVKAGGFYGEAYAYFKSQEEKKFAGFVAHLLAELEGGHTEQGADISGRIRCELAAAEAAKKRKAIFRFGKFLSAVVNAACHLGYEPSPAVREDKRGLMGEAIGFLCQRFRLVGVVALTPAHRHSRALRKTEKLFLQHLWLTWRELSGLPTSKPWAFGPGGHDEDHYIAPPQSKGGKFPLALTRASAADVGEEEVVA